MLQNYHYLYVDDDEMNRELMKLVMESIIATEHFTLFEDSKNFMERLDALEPAPDIFLLDIYIQPNDGFEMIKMIRSSSTWKDKPIIAVTASVRADDIEKLKATGFNGVIGKPLNLDTLTNLLETILSGEPVWIIT